MTTQVGLRDLERLQQLYEQGYRDPFVDNALHKIVDHQVARVESNLATVDATLQEFEKEYLLSSDEFWKLYQAGELEDTAEFMEWNTFYKMRQRLIAHLSILRGDHNHG